MRRFFFVGRGGAGNREPICGTSATARDAFTIGTSDFIFAVVEQPAIEPEDRRPAPDKGRWLMGLLPEIRGDFPPPSWISAFALLVSNRLEVRVHGGSLTAASFGVDEGGSYLESVPRLLLVSAVADRLEVRVNGQTYLDRPGGRLDGDRPLDLPFASVYVGGWDWDLPSFTGDVGEVVVIKGARVGAAKSQVEGYLRAKYGL